MNATANLYAYEAGAEFCAQAAADRINHQDGPGHCTAIPDGDYADMGRRFGVVTAEMEREYRRGYNETANHLED